MLIDQFHPQDPSSLIRSFVAVTSLRFVQESVDAIVKYMDIYDRVWRRFDDRTSNAPPSVAWRRSTLMTALRVVDQLEVSEVEYLINSLPLSLMRQASLMCLRFAGKLRDRELRTILRNINAELEYEKRL